MNYKQVINFWKGLQQHTESQDVINRFKNKPGYASERTLERYVQADRGFRQGLALAELSRKTGWGVPLLEKIYGWWKNEFSRDAPDGTAAPSPGTLDDSTAQPTRLSRPLRNEVQRLRQVLKTQPRQSLLPDLAIDRKIFLALRGNTSEVGLPALLDEHASALDQYNNYRERAIIEIRTHLKSLLPRLPGGMVIEAWDEHVLETLEHRVWGVDSEQDIPDEYREYRRGATAEGEQRFMPMWGATSLTRTFVTDNEYEVIKTLHQEFRSLAEGSLPDLWEAARPVSQVVAGLLDKLEDMVVNALVEGG